MTASVANRPHVPPVAIHRPPLVPEQILPNGLRLLRRSLPGRGMAAVHVQIGPGGRAEPTDGLARLLAGVCAMGPASHPGDTFINAMERAGAGLSGGADHDGAFLTATGPAERLADVMGLVADAVATPALRAEDVRHAVSRRLAALRTERLHPLHRAQDALRRLAFAPDSPYGRTARGTEESLSALDATTMARFHRHWYGPANASVLVVGDLECWDIAGRAAEAFSAWRHGVAPPAQPPISPADASTWEIHPRPGASQAMVMLGGVVATDDRQTLTAVEVAVNALGGWSGSRLHQALREDLGVTYGVQAEFLARRVGSGLSGEFRIFGAVEAAGLDAAMARLGREWTAVAEGALGTDEVHRSRHNLVSRELLLTQTVQHIVDVAGGRLRRGISADEQAERVDDLMGVTPAAAACAAAEFLSPARLHLVVVGDPEACERAVAPVADRLGARLVPVRPDAAR